MRILIAEDDKGICDLLDIYLSSENYETTVVHNGEDALKAFESESFDLAIFDIMMPKMNGFILTKKVRENYYMPILILSAKDEDHDKILGLNIGADDYITKPFNPLEIVARVNAHLRRSKRLKGNTLSIEKSYSDIVINIDNCRVFKNNEELLLTATEYKILNLLIGQPNRIFSKAQITRHINVDYFEGTEHSIVVHISNIREKLGINSKGDKYIKTVKGLGYRFE